MTYIIMLFYFWIVYQYARVETTDTPYIGNYRKAIVIFPRIDIIYIINLHRINELVEVSHLFRENWILNIRDIVISDFSY